MTCERFSALNYDLYVLGLLDESESAELDNHIQNQCSTCLKGVQRSMRLWLVFTSTLKNAEPSEAFKQRLLQITELSKSVLTFPKSTVISEHSRLSRSLISVLTAVVAVTLTLCGWYAGHTSGALEHQRLANQAAQVEQQLVSSQVQMRLEKEKSLRAAEALDSGGHTSVVNEVESLRNRLSQREAELSQFKALVERQRQGSDNSKDLLFLLASPGVHLLPLKGAGGALGSVGYGFVIPSSKLVFVASNLSDLPRGKEYQLWVLRKPDTAPVSAGVFAPDWQGHAYLQVDDAAITSDVTYLVVTDEPAGGSSAPTGSKLLIPENSAGS